jgi:hypothetical protein
METVADLEQTPSMELRHQIIVAQEILKTSVKRQIARLEKD